MKLEKVFVKIQLEHLNFIRSQLVKDIQRLNIKLVIYYYNHDIMVYFNENKALDLYKKARKR